MDFGFGGVILFNKWFRLLYNGWPIKVFSIDPQNKVGVWFSNMLWLINPLFSLFGLFKCLVGLLSSWTL